MDKLRCFVAVDFREELKKALVQVRNELKKWPARVKWVEPENYHLTLKFLGDVAAGDIPVIIDALGRAVAGQPALRLELTGVGAFPDMKRPRVIWYGIGGDIGALQSLHQAIDHGLRNLGIPGEKGTYRPHLTLGRVKESGPGQGPGQQTNVPRSSGLQLVDLVKGLAPVGTGPVIINEVALYESRLSRFGPTYSKVAVFALTNNDKGQEQ